MEYHAHTMPAAPIENRIDAVGHVTFWTMDLRGCDSGNHDTSYLSDACLNMPQDQRLQTFIFQTKVRNTVKPVEKNMTTNGIG